MPFGYRLVYNHYVHNLCATNLVNLFLHELVVQDFAAHDKIVCFSVR